LVWIFDFVNFGDHDVGLHACHLMNRDVINSMPLPDAEELMMKALRSTAVPSWAAVLALEFEFSVPGSCLFVPAP
jgi:hypothetical protein